MRYILILIFLTTPLYGGDERKTIFKYKKYEKINLGNLQVQGDIIAPGDLTVEKRKRKVFKRNLFFRSNFNKETLNNLTNFR